MPRKWEGKWAGGRFYLDEFGRKVFVVERLRRVFTLQTHDENLAVGELAAFLAAPESYAAKRAELLAPKPKAEGGFVITEKRIADYLESIRHTVKDHRNARFSYLNDWAEHGLDLATVDRARLFAVLDDPEKGGHRGRLEAINAFARWAMKIGELRRVEPWPVVDLGKRLAPKPTRAERVAYSVEQLNAVFAAMPAGPVRDFLEVRAKTGMHGSEIAQVFGAAVMRGPLPERKAGVRVLAEGHEIAGVVQVIHKSRRVHRVSVQARTLEAVLRLVEEMPGRLEVWKAFAPLVPSNLRHTFTTLAGEVGELITWSGSGVDRSRVAQVLGHRAGSTMTADRYDRLQVPPLIKLPFSF